MVRSRGALAGDATSLVASRARSDRRRVPVLPKGEEAPPVHRIATRLARRKAMAWHVSTYLLELSGIPTS